MNKIGLLFPGQGSQFVGMGKELIEKYYEAKQIYKQADKILGLPLTEKILTGPEEVLKATDIAQPAILTATIAIWEVLKKRYNFDFSACIGAGHSLGEYSALVANGVFDFATALKVVRKRGQLMQARASQISGGMAAILGLSLSEVQALCQKIDKQGDLQVANLNCPGQIVVSGTSLALSKLKELSENKKIKFISLAVSGPFHSNFMQPVAEEMSAVLSEINLSVAQFPIISNFTAELLENIDEIKNVIVKQITNSVKWEASMHKMIQGGVKLALEIGPGKVLRGLMRKIDKQVKVLNIFEVSEIEKVIPEIKEYLEEK